MIPLILLAFKQYHGGTNFDRTSGGPFIATSYDYDAPIDEYGMHSFFLHIKFILLTLQTSQLCYQLSVEGSLASICIEEVG